METNKVLFDYIMEHYGSVINFEDMSGISRIDVNAVLLKDNVSDEIGIGLKLCKALNIDIEKLVLENQIVEIEDVKPAHVPEKSDKPVRSGKSNRPVKPNNAAAKNEIYNKCMRLSEIEKRKVLDYIENILNKNKNDEQD